MAEPERTLILHLSDLHLGDGELPAEDAKITIPDAERRPLVDRLATYLRALPRPPDFVCVTGDIANRGDPDGFRAFLDWVGPLIRSRHLPRAERFLITPGNHDVRRGPTATADRFAGFYDVARAFPHAYVPGHDPRPTVPAITSATRTAGGMRTRKALGRLTVQQSSPFLYDRDARLLVFAFNSALACGVHAAESVELLEEIRQVQELADGDPALQQRLKKLHKRATDDLLLDAGLVGDEQITYFQELATAMRRALGAAWKQLTKVALLHHHVNPIWRQQLELKPFESIIDAAQVKQALTEFDFDVVLHGHKHKNGVSLDTTVVPTSTERRPEPISIVSGGTVCGYPALNDFQTFKILSFERSSSRETAHIEEYALGSSLDPEEAMKRERRTYPLPLFDRVPELHDDAALKDLLDELLIDEEASRMPAPMTRTDGGETQLPGDTEIVAAASRYRFASIVEAAGDRVFVDVFLATSRLDFRQHARIHWMLVDVKHLRSTSATSPRVLLLIGNLAGTHFSREREPGEIASSIGALRDAFRPALESGLLEIVDRPLRQEELDALDQTIPATGRRSL